MTRHALPDGATRTPPATTLALGAAAIAAHDVAEPRVFALGPLGLPRTYWALWAGMLLNRLGGSVFFLLSLYLTRERGLSAARAGLIISSYAAGGLFAGPVGGVLSDRRGRRWTLLVGTTAAGALMLALGGARSTAMITALAPVLGFFTDLCRPPLQAAVADVVRPPDRARAYGLLYWAINLGFAGAAALGGALAARHFGLLFVIDAATTLAYGAIVLFAVPETRPARRPRGDAPGAGAPGALAALAPFRDRAFARFTAIQVLLYLAFTQVIVALPLDMRAHGLGVGTIAFLLGLNGIFIVIAQPLALRFVRGVRPAHWLIAGAVLTGAGLGATAFASGAPGYIVASIIWTLGEVGFSTASPAIVAALAPIAARGAYQGTHQLGWGIAAMLAPVVGSSVLARFGSLALWGGCFGACLCAAALHLRFTAGHEARADGRTAPP